MMGDDYTKRTENPVINKINTVYQEAFKALEDGESITANPYPKRDPNHLRWLRAYNTAKCGSAQDLK